MAANQQVEAPLVPYGSNHSITSTSNNSEGSEGVARFPPGYRFSPTDVELVVDYLKKKVMNEPLPYSDIMKNVIREANLYEFDPEMLVAIHGEPDEKEWYFFTPRERKHTNGKRPNRVAGDGNWKATVGDKKITSNGTIVGHKRTLVFYREKLKTDWIMHEFIYTGYNRERTSLEDTKFDDCVLCHIYNRSKKPNNQSHGEKNGRPRRNEFCNGTDNSKVVGYGNNEPTPKKCRLSVCPQIYSSLSSFSHQPDYVPPTMEASYDNQNLMSLVPMQTCFGAANFPPICIADPIIVENGRFNYLMEGNHGYPNSMSQVPIQSNFANCAPIGGAAPPLLDLGAASCTHQPMFMMDQPASSSHFILQPEDSLEYCSRMAGEILWDDEGIQALLQTIGP